MMNLFRLLGDLSHLASIFILLHKIQKSRSCRGISFKTQLIYLIVFCTRLVFFLDEQAVSFQCVKVSGNGRTDSLDAYVLL